MSTFHVETFFAGIKYQSKDSKFVKCTSCENKMVAKNLKHTFIVALEKNGKQTNLTIFPNVLDDLSIDKTIIEDEL